MPGPLHRRQFIIDRSFHAIGPDWCRVDVPGEWVLSHCPALPLTHIDDGAVLIGDVVTSDTPVPTIEATRTWLGRWALIAGGRVFGDAAGLLGTFAAWRRPGEAVLSSSLALLAGLFPERRAHPRRIGWFGMGWYPPPASRLEGAVKLLPDMAFDLNAARVVPCERAQPDRYADLTVPALAAKITARLSAALRGLTTKFEHIALPLTGGHDSRMALAAAVASGTAVETFTLRFPTMAKADRLLPPELARRAGAPHRFIDFRPQVDPNLQRLWDAHCFGASVDMDRYFFSRRMFDWLKPGMIVTRCAGLGLSHAHFHGKFAGLEWPDAAATPALLAGRFKDWVSTKVEAAELGRWIAWREQHGLAGDWPDIFHRDQRMSGWLSAAEQGFDLLPAPSIQLVNCVEIQDLLMAAPHDRRASGELAHHVIKTARCGLEDLPVNPALDGLGHRVHQKLEREVFRATCEIGNMRRLRGWHSGWGVDPASGV